MEAHTETLTLYPDKKKIVGMLVISALFVAASVWMIELEESFGWVGLVFFGLGFLLTLVLLLPNTSYLRLRQDGFETRTLFKTYFTAWEEVQEFQVAALNNSTFVVYNYTAASQKHRVGRQFARDLAGFESSVSTVYGNSPQELAAVMNEWKLRHDLGKAAQA